VAHAFPSDLGSGNFHSTAVADNTFISDLLVLAAIAFPVFGGPEDPLAEKAILLGTERTVVDGFWLCHFTVGPLLDLLWRSK
jgi:hypothetical protein